MGVYKWRNLVVISSQALINAQILQGQKFQSGECEMEMVVYFGQCVVGLQSTTQDGIYLSLQWIKGNRWGRQRFLWKWKLKKMWQWRQSSLRSTWKIMKMCLLNQLLYPVIENMITTSFIRQIHKTTLHLGLSFIVFLVLLHIILILILKEKKNSIWK